MEERRTIDLGNRCDQKVDWCRATVLAPLREGRLHAGGGKFATVVKRQMPDLREVCRERAIVGRPAR
jgi:hypothetical protein